MPFLPLLDSGKDGLTAMGTLEKAASAFAKAYVSTKGSTQDRVKAGVKAAQDAIKADRDLEWQKKKINRDDRVVSETRK
jgi:hypothetical protein